MHTMGKRTKVTVGGMSPAVPGCGGGFAAAASALCVLALAACGGGGAKHADSPGTCPDGTMLKGDDCVPESASAAKSSDDDTPKGNTAGAASSQGAGQGKAGDSDTGGAASYDKDAVDAQLKRAAKQIKDNCGSASDEDGNKGGPWGSTTASVVLGRNGHVHEVTVPSPYSGKPVGVCVVNSFRKIQFPPYGGSTDVTVSWDVQIVEPKHK